MTEAAEKLARYHPLSMDDKVTLLGDPHADMAADLMDRVAARGVRSAGATPPRVLRERKIVELVAAGLSNLEIADQLTVSVRVVDDSFPAHAPNSMSPVASRPCRELTAQLDDVRGRFDDWWDRRSDEERAALISTAPRN